MSDGRRRRARGAIERGAPHDDEVEAAPSDAGSRGHEGSERSDGDDDPSDSEASGDAEGSDDAEEGSDVDEREDGPRSKPGLVTTLARRHGALVGSLGVLLVCVVAFALFRRELDEVHPVKDWLFWSIARLWGYNALLFAAALSLGHLVLDRGLSLRSPRPLEHLTHAVAVGLGLFGTSFFALGAMGLFRPWVAIGYPLVLLAVGGPGFARWAARALRKRPAPERRSALGRAISFGALAFGFCGVGVVYLPLLNPDSINFDASWCHLVVAQEFARAGKVVPFDGDYAKNLTLFMSVVHTWGWLMPMPDDHARFTMPLHTEMGVFLFTLVGVAALVEWATASGRSRPIGAWAGFFLFPAIFVYDSNLGGAADHFLAFFVAPCVLAAVRLFRRWNPRYALLLGFYAGTAMMTKYQAIYVLSGVVGVGAVMLTLRALQVLAPSILPFRLSADDRHTPRGRLFRAPLFAGLAFLASVSPIWIRNAVFHENPFYPFAQTLFPSRPTVPDTAFYIEYYFKDWNWRPHGTLLERLGSSLEVFFTFSVKPHYSFTKQWPMFGVLFTVALVLLPMLGKRPRLWILGAMGSLALFAWAFTFRVDRNLQTFAPALVAFSVATLVLAFRRPAPAKLGVALVTGLQLVWGADAWFYSLQDKLTGTLRIITSGYSKKPRSGFRSEFRAVHRATPPDAKILLHHFRRSLGIEREIVLDWVGQQGLITYADLGGFRALHERYAAIGITHLLHSPGGKPAPTKQDEILFHGYLRLHGVDRKRHGSFELARLAQTPPPPDPETFHVFVERVRHYRDGLYPLRALSVVEGLPEHLRKFPLPEAPLAKGQASALVSRAHALVLGSKAATKPPTNFVNVVSYRDFKVFVRTDVTRTAAPSSPREPPDPSEPREPGGASEVDGPDTDDGLDP